MAWVTVLGPDPAQVEYRLNHQCGCDAEATPDVQVDYRLLGSERPLEWVGDGLREFGIRPGTAVSRDAQAMVRAIMAGRDPHTHQRLVKPKMAVHPDAKLAARPLIEAVLRACQAKGITVQALLGDARLARRFDRLVRGVSREGEAHKAPIADLEAIAAAAGFLPERLWDTAELERARTMAHERIRVGNRGYDLVLDLPKSVSVLYGLADEHLAHRIEEIYLDCVRDTMAAVQQWAGYAMAGHHGDGSSAQRMETSGLLGTITLHRSARPVDGQVGDPHLHAHVMIANMVRGADGKWRTVAAGGRDLHRHARAADAYLKALLRRRLTAELGVSWQRDEVTAAWELSGITPEQRAVFARRAAQIQAAIGADASPAHSKTTAAQLAEAKQNVAPGHARQAWRQRALDAGIDPDRLVATVLGGGTTPATSPSPKAPSPEDLAKVVFDPEHGVTATRKVVTRADVLSAVMEALPGGIDDIDTAEKLTDKVLATRYAVRLPDAGATHLSNAARYTSWDVVGVERLIAAHAHRRRYSRCAQVSRWAAATAIAEFEAERGFRLSAQQRAVVKRLLRAGHGVEAVIGVAGAGKTTIMSAAARAWKSQGLVVRGAATAAVAAANLAAESGIPSKTVASWLQTIATGKGLNGVDVLVVDEAAMVDDRSMAKLLVAAERAGTKVVGIGDPKQLRAVGIGGGFARVHQIVNGLVLAENRRQRAEVDRTILALWRGGTETHRRAALQSWAGAGRIYATRSVAEAHTALLDAWWRDRRTYSDPHEALSKVLMLAARNADVDALNARARLLARLEGHLHGDDVDFALRGGERITLAPGDLVRVRANDYRSRRGEGVDVLNGYRGVVREVEPRQGALVEWRRSGRTYAEWISPDQIAAGHLSHGYAMTVAAAQGLTCENAYIYGLGADGHTLYPAMSRAKGASRLYLPLEAVESLEAQLEHGPVRSPADLLHRAVAAYAATLGDPDDGMVVDELDAALAKPKVKKLPTMGFRKTIPRGTKPAPTVQRRGR